MLEKIKFYKGKETDVDATLYTGGILYIKGTYGGDDIKQDLMFWPTLREEYKMHKGAFLQAQELLQLIGDDKVVKVYAHSLGASVGALVAIKLNVEGHLCGGFRPFVLWQKFDNPPKITNYIYNSDIVPRIFLLRKYCGKVERIKGKGFHPFTDHLRYQTFKELFNASWVEEEL